ncbi:MAG TPA: CHC2 zinc finger domain-containing protein [Bryobacteraceae bacterium]|nr:CHC2 zinc finger domain-containing protein [Bryobacteraceae bacterium]
MARIPDEVIERLKQEVSLERLAEARGVKLTRHGADLIGLCPFHDDHEPSLVISPQKNLWHCLGACRAGGTVIDWVMKSEGVSFHHAAELLRSGIPSSSGPVKKISTVRRLRPPVERDASDRALLDQIVGFYHTALKQSPEALKYLERRGLTHPEMIARFRLGFANRTLGLTLAPKNRKAGAEMRTRLEELGILRDSTGHEHLNGSLVIPIFSRQGEVVQMYGRKIGSNLTKGTPLHLYLPGPHRGVWNEEALEASKEVILCEALIDALTFWCAGYRNVTASYGVNGFTDDHRAAFGRYGVKRVYLAYDRDAAGDQAASALADELMASGIECFRVLFPKGMDANEYARTTQPAAKALGVLLTAAQWLGRGRRVVSFPAVPVEPTEEQPAAKEKMHSPASAVNSPQEPESSESKETKEGTDEPVLSLAADPDPLPSAVSPAEPNPPDVNPAKEEPAPRAMPMAATAEPEVKIDGDEITVTMPTARVYRVLGLYRNTSLGTMKVNVTVSGRNLRGEFARHGDTLDLEQARNRALFIKQAAHELGVREDLIQREVGRLWSALEDLQRAHLKKALEPQEEEPAMTAGEKEAALALLRDPCLLARVLEDFEKCGVTGEETNKTISYLAAVSRLLDKPLSVVVQSSSSAGKSSLIEAVLDFMPKEQREEYSAMTGQALFYMKEKSLKHKILAVSEEEGASKAAYALKLLQSEGVLRIASTGKDPVSGKLVTHEYEVEGPVTIFLTTTAQEVDEELLNRSILLTVNEEREQTRAIHRRQREARTIEGLWARRTRERIVNLHRNAQTLLRPIAVVNNLMDDDARFPDHMTRTRRDHVKLLTLVEAVALVYQHQREIRTETRDGETLEYIEATAEDVALARRLMEEVLGPALDELPPQTRRLLGIVERMVNEESARQGIDAADYRFTRRTLREYTGRGDTRWGDTQLRVHLRRLEEMEYLSVRHGGQGQTFVYKYDAHCAGSNDNFAGPEDNFAGGARPLRGAGFTENRSTESGASELSARFGGSIYRGFSASVGPVADEPVVVKPVVVERGSMKVNGRANGKLNGAALHGAE